MSAPAPRIRPTDEITRIVQDVERALRDSEARTQAILAAAADAIISIDDRGRIEAFNPAAERMFGYAFSEVASRNISMLMPEPYRSEHDEYLRRYLATGERKVIGIGRDAVGLRKDGDTFPMELSVSEVELGDRRMFTGIVRDVTERKRVEAALRESEARVRAVVETAVDAVISIDTEGVVEAFNRAAEQMFGYEAGQVIGRNISMLMPEPYRSEHDAYLKHYLTTGQRKIIGIGREAVGLRRNGETFPIDLAVSEVEVGDRHLFTGVVRDISDRKEAERRLALASAMIESSSEAIIGLTLDGQVRTWNPAACNLYGLPPSDALGRNFVDLVAPTGHEDEHRLLLNRVRNGEPVRCDDVRHRCGDDRTIDVAFVGSPTRDASGKVIGISVICRDVTERKRRLAELEEARQRLQQKSDALGRTAVELGQANLRIEKANQAKSEFLANMSHEIRTPMTAILGFAEVIQESDTSREQADAADTIRRNGEYLLELINDILDLSKIEAGKVHIEPVVFSPRRLVADIVELMKVRAEGKGVSLEAQAVGDVPAAVRTDPTRLRQVLVNLVGNAVKFTEVGGVRIEYGVEGAGKSTTLSFRVVDSGIGMSAEQIARLYRPFEQADASTTRRFGGTGLGLAITKRLTEMLGGSIQVESAEGEGSAFEVRVPAQACAEPTNSEAESSADASEHVATAQGEPVTLDCRILLAEDAPDNQRLIRFVLQRAGAQVVVVENGQLAVAAALAAESDDDPPAAPFDVVLMDMQMPIMDGYEATRQLRSQGFRSPIIALTAHAMAGADNDCLAAGCDAYSAKPIQRDELIKLVKRFTTATPTVQK